MGLFGPPSVDKLARNYDVNGLIEALNDPERWKQAVQAMGKLKDEIFVEPLLGQLQSLKAIRTQVSLCTLDMDARTTAAEKTSVCILLIMDALDEIGSPLAIDELKQISESNDDFFLQCRASQMLVKHREAEISKLTDQATLAKIALRDKSREIRLAAVMQLTDQATLAKIALKDKSREMRLAAVKQLSDRDVLAQIALRDKSREMRLAAVKQLSDRDVLAQIGTADKDTPIRETAFQRYVELGVAAVELLTDQATLAKIAETDISYKVCEAAISRITDQTLLAAIASGRSKNRTAAISRLTDQTLLAKIAFEDPDGGCRAGAVLRLTDENVLDRIIRTDKDESVGATASQRRLSLRVAACRHHEYGDWEGNGNGLDADATFNWRTCVHCGHKIFDR